YVEPEEIAYKHQNEIHANFIRCTQLMFEKGMYPCIATHHKKLINTILAYIKSNKIVNSLYEIQMLYGVAPRLRDKLILSGYNMRIYLPYGKDWFNYSTRRLRENPYMIYHIIKALFTRN
ncbi:MAG: proline dehydrogenase family protein, partial [Bacteroidales bacterium]|nr:proline dehydrogenase family protein [Bacteroidales bacterium]